MRQANLNELSRIWPLLKDRGAHPDFEAFSREALSQPDNLICSDEDPLAAALLGRWRERLPIGWIRAFSAGRKPYIFAREVGEELLDRGFETALSPIIERSSVGTFKRAGFEECQAIVIMAAPSKAPNQRPETSAEIEPLTPDRIDLALAIEGESFDGFWRYGKSDLLPLLSGGKAFVAMLNGHPVGYTMVGVDAGRGILIRLAVCPDFRNRGIGRHLAWQGISWLVRSGARELLVATQRSNETARRLYESNGFRRIDTHYLLSFSR